VQCPYTNEQNNSWITSFPLVEGCICEPDTFFTTNSLRTKALLYDLNVIIISRSRSLVSEQPLKKNKTIIPQSSGSSINYLNTHSIVASRPKFVAPPIAYGLKLKDLERLVSGLMTACNPWTVVQKLVVFQLRILSADTVCMFSFKRLKRSH
jgi:hypothetical protein